jgi:hypothetical protein
VERLVLLFSEARTCHSASSWYDVRSHAKTDSGRLACVDALRALQEGHAVVVSGINLGNRHQSERRAILAAIQQKVRHARLPCPRAGDNSLTGPWLGVKGEGL